MSASTDDEDFLEIPPIALMSTPKAVKEAEEWLEKRAKARGIKILDENDAEYHPENIVAVSLPR